MNQMNVIKQYQFQPSRGAPSQRVLFERAGKYYVASWLDTGELLVFHSTPKGDIIDWSAVDYQWANYCQHLFS